MAALIPTPAKNDDRHLMSHGYDPELSTWSLFHGAVYAVTESLAKICAAGGDVSRARLTFQEYFERLNRNKLSWGKPAAALLGGLSAQLGFGTASIGGKDSMSGTFEDIHVPPTPALFAVAWWICATSSPPIPRARRTSAGAADAAGGRRARAGIRQGADAL